MMCEATEARNRVLEFCMELPRQDQPSVRYPDVGQDPEKWSGFTCNAFAHSHI
jgi:hypothetical protein